MRDALGDRWEGAVRFLTVAVLTVVGIVPIAGNHVRVQDVDPQFMRTVVDRTARFGGTFYENGIYNKGPLEPAVYDLARRLTSYDGFWFAISFFVVLAALALAYTAARTARLAGAPAPLALAIAVALFVHLTLSDADYAGVLYSRNMTVVLLAAAFLLTFDDRAWSNGRRATVAAVAVGTALGLVAQTLLSQSFAAAALGLAALAMAAERAGEREAVRLRRLALVSGGAAFAAAPLYYLLRGTFAEFWASWWTHARLMNVGTGRSLSEQLTLGWNEGYAYYQARPLGLAVVVGFVVLAADDWRRGDTRSRLLHLALGGWLAGAWMELVLSQRYSSHYFVVTTVPTVLMAAVLAGRVYAAWSQGRPVARSAVAWPLIAAVLAVYLSGPQHLVDAAQRTSTFTSAAAAVEERAAGRSGDVRTVRAVLDLVSERGDPLLAWTTYPWTYLDHERVPATRFSWSTFLIGAIYLGRTSDEFILSRTDEWFRADLAEADPVAYLDLGEPPRADTAFADVLDGFEPVFPGGSVGVHLRRDVARSVLEGDGGGRTWEAPAPPAPASGWRVGPGEASYRESAPARPDDRLPLAVGSCVRVDGTVDTDEDALPGLVFRFTDDAGRHEPLRISLDGTTVRSAGEPVGYLDVDSGLRRDEREPVPFSLVVGRRSAVLVVAGQVRGALRLPPSVSVAVEPAREGLALRSLSVAGPPPGSGC